MERLALGYSGVSPAGFRKISEARPALNRRLGKTTDLHWYLRPIPRVWRGLLWPPEACFEGSPSQRLLWRLNLNPG